MIHKPENGNSLPERAGSLLFFALALLVILISAFIDQAQSFTPLQLNSGALLLLLVLLLIWFVYRLRKMD